MIRPRRGITIRSQFSRGLSPSGGCRLTRFVPGEIAALFVKWSSVGEQGDLLRGIQLSELGHQAGKRRRGQGELS